MVESTVESTAESTAKTYSGQVRVSVSDLKDRNAKKRLINLPAAIPAPAGRYYLTLSKHASGVESTVDSTAKHDLLKRLVLLMVRAGIDSDQYQVKISPSEVMPIIGELRGEGQL